MHVSGVKMRCSKAGDKIVGVNMSDDDSNRECQKSDGDSPMNYVLQRLTNHYPNVTRA